MLKLYTTYIHNPITLMYPIRGKSHTSPAHKGRIYVEEINAKYQLTGIYLTHDI